MYVEFIQSNVHFTNLWSRLHFLYLKLSKPIGLVAQLTGPAPVISVTAQHLPEMWLIAEIGRPLNTIWELSITTAKHGMSSSNLHLKPKKR